MVVIDQPDALSQRRFAESGEALSESRPTVGRQDGALVEGGAPPTERGRRPTLLHVRTREVGSPSLLSAFLAQELAPGGPRVTDFHELLNAQGDPETVEARMREYMDLGIDTFILSGYPHLEESYRFAELMFPRLGVVPDGVGEAADAFSTVFGTGRGEFVGHLERPLAGARVAG